MSDQIKLETGIRLKAERERLNLTQTDLAKALDVNRYSALKYESGMTSPTVEHLYLLDKLGADIYFITTGKRKTLSADQRASFATLFLALQNMGKMMNSNPEAIEVLEAAWMLFDVQASGADVADTINSHPKAISAIFGKNKAKA